MARDQAPLLPASVRLRARPYLCDDAGDWSEVPATHDAAAGLADAGLPVAVGSGPPWAARDSVHAIYDAEGIGPQNADAIEALAERVGLDLWGWRLAAYDRAYVGIVAPAPDATIGAVLWSYRADDASTRVASEPTGGEPVRLGHADPAHDCPNCVPVYPEHASVAGGTVTLPRKLLCLERGELVERPLPPDSFSGCCGKCSQPFTLSFSATRCFYPGQPFEAPTLTVTGPNGVATTVPLAYANGTNAISTFRGSMTAQDQGTYTYTYTSNTTFSHTGSITVANCSGASFSDILYSSEIRLFAGGCPGPIPGASFTVDFGGTASGSGVAGSNGYAIIRLTGSEPPGNVPATATASAPLYKTGTIRFNTRTCDSGGALETADCYDCYNRHTIPGNQIGNVGLPGDDPGCVDPQGTSGTMIAPFGATCYQFPQLDVDYSEFVYPRQILGNVTALGFNYKFVEGQGDVTCKQPLEMVTFPVYLQRSGYYNQSGQFRLLFASVQRCDPNAPKDRCTYPVAGTDPNTSVSLTVVHKPNTCNPVELSGTPNIGNPCTVGVAGVTSGVHFEFLGDGYRYIINNCGCTGGGPDNPYGDGSNPYMVVRQSLPPLLAASAPAGRPSVRTMLRLLDEARDCPHRTAPPCGCPQVPGACGLGRGGSRGVTLQDCLACRRDDAVTVVSHLNGFTGYGQQATRVAMELEKLGLPVTFDPIERDESFIPVDEWAKARVVTR